MHGAAGMTLLYIHPVPKIGKRLPMWGKRPFRGKDNIKIVTVVFCNLNLLLIQVFPTFWVSWTPSWYVDTNGPALSSPDTIVVQPTPTGAQASSSWPRPGRALRHEHGMDRGFSAWFVLTGYQSKHSRLNHSQAWSLMKGLPHLHPNVHGWRFHSQAWSLMKW